MIADGWIHEKPCRMTIDSGASVTSDRSDIVAGIPERNPSRPYVLQRGSGETIPVVTQARVELTLWQRALKIWFFIPYITDDFILGLDIPRAYDASVDVG